MLRYLQHTNVKQNLLYLACDWVTNCLIKHKSLIMIDIFSQIFTDYRRDVYNLLI